MEVVEEIEVGKKKKKKLQPARSTRQEAEGHVLLDDPIRMLAFICVLVSVSVCESINKN